MAEQILYNCSTKFTAWRWVWKVSTPRIIPWKLLGMKTSLEWKLLPSLPCVKSDNSNSVLAERRANGHSVSGSHIGPKPKTKNPLRNAKTISLQRFPWPFPKLIKKGFCPLADRLSPLLSLCKPLDHCFLESVPRITSSTGWVKQRVSGSKSKSKNKKHWFKQGFIGLFVSGPQNMLIDMQWESPRMN